MLERFGLVVVELILILEIPLLDQMKQ